MTVHRQNIAIIFFFFLFLSVFALPANAQNAPNACQTGEATQETNTVQDSGKYELLHLTSSYFLDSTGSLPPAEVSTQVFISPLCGNKIMAPLPGEILWLRFSLQSKHDHPINWAVTFLETIFDRVVLYEFQQDKLHKIAQNGRTIPAPEKANGTIKPGLPVSLEPNEAKSYYVRVEGTLEPTITPVIVSQSLLSDWSDSIIMLVTLFLSYLLALIVFSLILFRQIDVRFYKYYTLYLSCLFFFSFFYVGLANQYLGMTTSIILIAPIVFSVSAISLLSYIQYCRILLEIDDQQPRLRILLNSLSTICVITMGLAAYDPWELSLPLHLFYVLCPAILLVVASIRIRDGVLPAKPVAVSLVFFSGGLAIAVYYFIFPLEIAQATHAYELILRNPLSWGYYLAIIGETTFMMVAISVMVKVQKRSALAEVTALQRNVSERERMLEKSGERITALEASLAQDPGKNLLPPADQRFLQRATDCIITQVGNENYGVRELAADLATSEKTLGRRIQKTRELTSAAFIRSTRLGFARELLLLHQYDTIAEVAGAAGFSSVSYFSKMYRLEFNETPGETLKR